ncbi:hypothetical protein FACS1894132_08730 [Clostridia bacterium]|nr:hypothetical protein FACS1894132_08730 [Clostridia bacterium]
MDSGSFDALIEKVRFTLYDLLELKPEQYRTINMQVKAERNLVI